MNNQVETIPIGEGIRFSSISNKKFKTNRISLNFITPMKEDTVTVNALIPQVLKDGFHGCEDFMQLNRRLEELYGADINVEAMKSGDSQILTLSVTGIDDAYSLHQEPVAAQMANILCDMVLHPLIEEDGFSKQYIKLEKHALEDAIDAQINQKRGYAISQMLSFMCAGEPYGLPRLGFKEKIADITPQQAKAAYDFLLQNARIEILFVGSGNAAPVLAVFQKAFASIVRRGKGAFLSAPHPVRKEILQKTEHLPVSQSKLVLSFANGLSPLDPSVPAIRMMTAVLGGTTTSKLFLNVRERLSLCYYCAARYDSLKGVCMVDSGVESQNVERAKAEIFTQLEEIRKGNVTDEEMNNARLYMNNAFSAIGENPAAIEGFYLGQFLIGSNSTPEKEKEKINAVTLQDVVCAAKKMIPDTVYLLTGEEK